MIYDQTCASENAAAEKIGKDGKPASLIQPNAL
jgi:hypothetical protein